jgi:hypothetical protein
MSLAFLGILERMIVETWAHTHLGAVTVECAAHVWMPDGSSLLLPCFACSAVTAELFPKFWTNTRCPVRLWPTSTKATFLYATDYV